LFAQPGTTLMRPACNARIPARTTGAGCIIKSFSAGVISLLLRVTDRPSPGAIEARARDATDAFLQLHPLPTKGAR
jgi:hypothetical protein